MVVNIHGWTESNQTSPHQVQIALFSFQYLEHKLFLHLLHFKLYLEFDINKIHLIFLLTIFLIDDQFAIKDFHIHFLTPLIYFTFFHGFKKYSMILDLKNNDLIILEYLVEYYFINFLQKIVLLLLNQQYFAFDY